MKVITLKELNKREDKYFVLVDANGKAGKTVWVYDYWDIAVRRYLCRKYEDSSSWRLFKPTQKITTDFEF